MSPPVRIRRVNANDPEHRQALLRMHLDCYSKAELNLDLFDQGAWWIGYDQDGQPVAFAGIRRSIQWTDTGYLSRAGVLPRMRGHGLQKKLIRVRLRYAKKQGWNWVITDTRLNPASANSLIALGFQMYQPSQPWSFKDACYWRKKLT